MAEARGNGMSGLIMTKDTDNSAVFQIMKQKKSDTDDFSV